MKRLIIFIILMGNFTCFSQTQAEMNKGAYLELAKTDKTLNDIYINILSQYKSDTLFLGNLKKSQRIWMKFRDAEMKMKFPNYPDKIYGSIQPTCRAFYLNELTKKRIKTLKEWVSGIEEGDVCSGSVKTVEEIDYENIEKAYIQKNGFIRLTVNMKKDHRIFGYKNKDTNSEKLILLSIFTNEVKNNPFNCMYGAFYETSGMTDMKLKYIATENEFVEIGIIKNNKMIDKVFMLKRWFEYKK